MIVQMTEYQPDTTPNKRPLRAIMATCLASAALLSCSHETQARPIETTTITETQQSVAQTTEAAPVTMTITETPPPPPAEAPINCLVDKCIALTFDDGPGAYTNEVLDDLASRHAQATFFMVGTEVQQYPDTVRRIAHDGHQLGNHSWNHKQLTALGADAAAEDIRRTNDLIAQTTGIAPKVMRPPYGSTNQSIINAVGMPEIIWSIDPQDWKYHDSDYVADHIISHAEPGAIALMHDIHKTTVNAVPRILDALQSDGYKLVTIDTLLGSNLPVGKYSHQ